MKIAVVDTTIDGELIGGAHTFLPKLLAGLRERRNEIHLVTKSVPDKKVLSKIEESGAALHYGLWNVDGFVEDTAPVLAEWINHLAPDIYLISASADIGWAVLPLLEPEIATLTVGHTDSETFYLPTRHYHSFLTRAIGVSPEICANYALTCNISKERIDWIPYGVATSEREPQAGHENYLKMIYVGRLEEEQKRISDLIKTVKILSAQNIKYRLSIIGDGEEMPNIKEHLLGEIGDGRVSLHGWLESDKVIEAMRQAEVFVLTSAYEGFCIALVESMANGCCPVVTDIRSGNKQLVKNGINGFLTEIGDAESFAGKLKFLSENRAKLFEMRKLAWQTGKEYGVEKMVESYQHCFEKAVSKAKKSLRTKNINFPLMETCRSIYPLWLRRIKKMAVSLR